MCILKKALQVIFDAISQAPNIDMNLMNCSYQHGFMLTAHTGSWPASLCAQQDGG